MRRRSARFILRLLFRCGRQQLDLHTGGIDLAFPHHENEIAQCEAAFNSSSEASASAPTSGAREVNADREWKQWCNYFVHTGHLHIAGRKMSKSLKNFISIDEYLSTGGPDAACRFRIFCLMHKYNANVHYSEDRIVDAEAVLRRFRELFVRAERMLNASASGDSGSGSRAIAPMESPVATHWCESSRELVQCLEDCCHSVRSALSNDLDTPTAMAALLSAISRTHSAMDAAEKRACPGEKPQVQGLWPVVRYISQQLRLFGLTDQATGAFDYIAVAPKLTTMTATESSKQRPDVKCSSGTGGSQLPGGASAANAKLVNALLRMRVQLRTRAMEGVGLTKAELWSVCDSFRDELLPAAGVKVEDLRDGTQAVSTAPRSR